MDMNTTQMVEMRSPDKAIIKCHHRDDYVEEFVQWYSHKKLKYEVQIDENRNDIEVDLLLGDELLDRLGCPHME